MSPRLGRLLIAAVIFGGLVTPSAAGLAQTVRPPVSTTPSSQMLEKLRRETTRPVPSVPRHPAPADDMVWVPDRHVRVPGVQGDVWVPGHWERKTSAGEHYAPPLVGRTPEGGAVNFPAGARPPVEERQGP